jgi:hypothetical protein
MTKTRLAILIQARLQDLPVSDPGVIRPYRPTLRTVLARDLLERICDEAADVALAAFQPVDEQSQKGNDHDGQAR